jgi:hypothetical protein
MRRRTKDKIYLIAWSLDKYHHLANEYGKVNNKPIKPMDLMAIKHHRKYVRSLYRNIMAKGYIDYRISREELLELNTMYTQYKIDLDIHPQYTPPSVSGRLQDR